MQSDSIIKNLFPTPIGMYTFPRPFTPDELKYISELEKSKNVGNQFSKDSYVLQNEILKDIYDFCVDSVDNYFQQVHQPKNHVNLKITQSWFNYTEKNEYHHKHTHSNSFVSGVMYIQTDDSQDRIYFFKNQFQPLKIPAAEFNVYNSESWWFESLTGQLLLFPSSLEHMVSARPDIDQTRISLSFNTFPQGILGNTNELTELILQ